VLSEAVEPAGDEAAEAFSLSFLLPLTVFCSKVSCCTLDHRSDAPLLTFCSGNTSSGESPSVVSGVWMDRVRKLRVGVKVATVFGELLVELVVESGAIRVSDCKSWIRASSGAGSSGGGKSEERIPAGRCL